MGTYFIEEKGYTLLLGCWKLPLSYKMQAHWCLLYGQRECAISNVKGKIRLLSI